MISLPAFSQGGGYEGAPIFGAASLLPAEMQAGATYKVKEQVSLQGFFYSFQLWSRYGWYNPQSMDMLRIRLAEIRALDTLTAMQQDPLFLEGVGDQVGGTISSTVNVIKHPVRSIAQIPLGLEKFGEQMHAKAKEGDTLPDQNIRGIHEEAKRKLAVSLGVDPYTDNQPLQDALNNVATNKNRGALMTRVGTVFIPAVGPALGAAQLNKGLQDRLANMTSAQLQEDTRNKLTRLGVPSVEVKTFMTNPGYTPTSRAAITDALLGLQGVAGIQNYIRLIQEVSSREVAIFFQRRIQLAEIFNRTVRPLDKMVLAGPTPAFLDRQENVILTPAVDYLYWNEDIARRVSTVRKKIGTGSCDLYITGIASNQAKQQLSGAGITVHEKLGN
jgi:hypothetical protein